jgi:hypothetical protein
MIEKVEHILFTLWVGPIKGIAVGGHNDGIQGLQGRDYKLGENEFSIVGHAMTGKVKRNNESIGVVFGIRIWYGDGVVALSWLEYFFKDHWRVSGI